MDFLKAVILGKNIVGFVLDSNGYFYDENDLLGAHQQAEVIDIEFQVNVLWSVSEIIDANFDEIYTMFNEFKSHENWKDPSYFGSSILAAAPTFFQRGYSPEHFLAFCAVASGVTAMFYEEEVNCLDFADVTANVIGLVLIGHIITGEFFRRGSWKQLYAVAKTFLSTI